MQDIMPPVDTVDNLFHDGNPVTGEQGTIVSAEFLNNLQGATRDTQTELKSILTAAGIAVDPDKQNQVLTALSKLYLSRVNPGADIAADGAAAIATFLANLGLGEGANWVMLPGGMIIQRVYLGFPIGTNVRHITFPRSFTTTNYSISINWNDIGTVTTETQSPANVAVVHQTKSLTGASIWQAGPGGFNVDIIAVGY